VRERDSDNGFAKYKADD
jgi:hypothetical protein